MSAYFSIGDERVRVLRDGKEAFPAMYEALQAAHREILVEMYWIGADQVGRRLRDILIERAKSGVVVRVIYDAVGSLGLLDDFFNPLRDAGGFAVAFHALWPFSRSFRFGRVDQRDHRKMVVIDGERAFVGGLNFALQWQPVDLGGAGWKDDVVEVVGATAEEARTLFYKSWKWLTDEAAPEGVRSLPRSPGPVGFFISQRGGRRNVRSEYLRLFKRAKRSIDITNAYFVPDFRIRRALYRARERNVRIRLLLPEASDIPMMQSAAEALYDKFLRLGIELYIWSHPFLHNKTVVVDRESTLIGSFNFDERSVRNLEANVRVRDRAFAAEVTRAFESDLAGARRVNLDEWRNRSVTRQALEALALSFRRFL